MPKSSTPEKPIIFSRHMVQAILSGRKTQTRRVIKGFDKQATFVALDDNAAMEMTGKDGETYPKALDGLWATFERDGEPQFPMVRCPYQPGDILWAREAWRQAMDGYTGVDFGGYWYRADSATPEYNDEYNPWRSPIFMPREAARIFLRVTNVRVERVQDISEEDALAEGCEGEVCYDAFGEPACWKTEPTEQYANLWDKLNAKRGYPWGANPWVWVYEFKRVEEGDHAKHANNAVD